MKRIILIVVVGVGVLLLLPFLMMGGLYVFGVFSSADERRIYDSAPATATSNASAPMVFSSRDIKEGELIQASALEQRFVDPRRRYVDAFESAKAIVGKKAKYSIAAHTVVSKHAVAASNADR